MVKGLGIDAQRMVLDVPRSLSLLDSLLRAGFMCAFPMGGRLQRLLVSGAFTFDCGNRTLMTVWYHKPAAQHTSQKQVKCACLFQFPCSRRSKQGLRANHLFGR